MTASKKQAKAEEVEDRGPGPELAETLVSVQDDPAPEPVEED